jgi:hypothetical protein
MSKYTLKGSPELDARIDSDLRRISEAVRDSRYGSLYRALVLIGGYARGEGTPFLVNGKQVPFNDYDLVVVSKPLNRRQRAGVQSDLRGWESTLSAELNLPVDLCLYPENVLRQAEFSLLNYEMKYGHLVVWGEQDIIGLLPEYPHDRIPLSEGTRLLMNRGKLLLDVRRALRTQTTFTDEERIRYIKFLFKALLAFGDCTLLAHADYDLLYSVKKERIGNYVDADMPDPAFMVEGFRRAVAFKEWGDFQPLEKEAWREEFERICRYYVLFLQWYEKRRVGADIMKVGEYLAALATAGRECGVGKAIMLNLRLFGWRALECGGRLVDIHPRARLYLALPRLLGGSCSAEELQHILSVSSGQREAMESQFYKLQKRVS